MDELLTVAELAQWLKVPPSWIYRAVRTDGGQYLAEPPA